MAYSHSHSNTKALKLKLAKYWDEIRSDILRATCSDVIPRLKRVIEARGGYIEK